MSPEQLTLGGVVGFLLCMAFVFGKHYKDTSTSTLLGATILHQNNMQVYWKTGLTVFPVVPNGGQVHKIGASTAQAVADELEAVVLPPAPMHVACGLLASESVMDPLCVDECRHSSNPEGNPLKFDCGIGQTKLEFLPFNPAVGLAVRQAFAFDITKAIPYFWGLYNDHLVLADKWIAGNTRSDIDPRMMNRYALAGIIYKQGPTGAAAIFADGKWDPELNNFASLCDWYAAALNEKSVFDT